MMDLLPSLSFYFTYYYHSKIGSHSGHGWFSASSSYCSKFCPSSSFSTVGTIGGVSSKASSPSKSKLENHLCFWIAVHPPLPLPRRLLWYILSSLRTRSDKLLLKCCGMTMVALRIFS